METTNNGVKIATVQLNEYGKQVWREYANASTAWIENTFAAVEEEQEILSKVSSNDVLTTNYSEIVSVFGSLEENTFASKIMVNGMEIDESEIKSRNHSR